MLWLNISVANVVTMLWLSISVANVVTMLWLSISVANVVTMLWLSISVANVVVEHICCMNIHYVPNNDNEDNFLTPNPMR